MAESPAQGRIARGHRVEESIELGVVVGVLEFHLRDGVAEHITCPVLVCSAGDDIFFAGDGATKPQPQELFDHLVAAPARLQHFTADEGADAHGHAGAERLTMARIFDWLDTTLPQKERP